MLFSNYFKQIEDSRLQYIANNRYGNDHSEIENSVTLSITDSNTNSRNVVNEVTEETFNSFKEETSINNELIIPNKISKSQLKTKKLIELK